MTSTGTGGRGIEFHAHLHDNGGKWLKVHYGCMKPVFNSKRCRATDVTPFLLLSSAKGLVLRRGGGMACARTAECWTIYAKFVCCNAEYGYAADTR